MMIRRNRFGLLFPAILLSIGAANESAAQSVQAPAACLSPPSVVNETLAEMREKMLVADKTFDMAAVAASPEAQKAHDWFVKNMQADWPDLCHYRSANHNIPGGSARVVFVGDSITENWVHADSPFFTQGILNRGISGQVSAQVLLRFFQDVVSLKPIAVHLMIGTNDIANIASPNTDEDYKNNITAMADIARAHHIRLILASIPPMNHIAWQPNVAPGQRVLALNRWLRKFAEDRKLIYVDYYTALADGQGGLNTKLGNDGVHPNRNGYGMMRPAAQRAIAQALARR